MALIIDNRDIKRISLNNQWNNPYKYNREEIYPYKSASQPAMSTNTQSCFKVTMICLGILVGLLFLVGIGGAIFLLLANILNLFKSIWSVTYGLVNYWPIYNNDISDHVGAGTPTSSNSVSFVTNRLSWPNQAEDCNVCTVKLPTGVYFYGSFTFMFWINLNQVSSNSQNTIFYCGVSPNSDYVVIYLDTSNYIWFFVMSGTSSITQAVSVQPLTVGTWTHVTVTWDNSLGLAVIFINAAVSGSASGLGTLNSVSRDDCDFGANGLLAYLDEIRNYDRLTLGFS